jgi:ubiquinone/menaquinone biosynthesis C-methylase UbiE
VKSLKHRRREHEWMDDPNVDEAILADSLRFIHLVNRLLRYSRSTLEHLDRFSRNWKPGEPISIIDFATGSADIPRDILRWADRRGHNIRIVGVDLHARTSAIARQSTSDPRLQIVRADVLNLPFDAGSFDYAITGLFLHHLSDDEVIAVLRALDRVARRGIIIGDLIRSRRAYNWITLFTLFANPMLKHDARVSVAQAFNKEEILRLRDRAGLGYLRYHRHFAHRMVLAGEKPTDSPSATA